MWLPLLVKCHVCVMLYSWPIACPLSSKCCDNKNVQHICIICIILYVLCVDTSCGVQYFLLYILFFVMEFLSLILTPFLVSLYLC
jgi:hypothetical protein